MPADPVHPGQLGGQARFRADLAAYLDSLPIGELAELLGELPSTRQQPLQLGVLMIALNERLPDSYKLLPPAGHPGPGEGRRRTLRQVVADRRAPARPSTPARQRRSWPSGCLTANSRPTYTPSAAGRVWLASGGWPRRCAPGPVTPLPLGRPPRAQ
jgi:hypothetical protein